MGVRGFEIDFWWCFGKMLMSYDYSVFYEGCVFWDREYEDGIREIGEWVYKLENIYEIIRLYFEDGLIYIFGYDFLINGFIV